MPESCMPTGSAQPSPSDAGSAPRPLARASYYILPITLLALALRLAIAVVVVKSTSPHWFFSQATELGCLATSLLNGLGFSSPFGGQTGPSAFLAPGYPLFVAAVFRLFGPYTMHSAACIVFIQAFFGTAVIPVTMWGARHAFGARASNLAGLLCAITPWLIGQEAVFWETSLSILLVTALVGLAVALHRDPSRRRWYTAAGVLALAVSVNPSLVLGGLALFVAAFVTGPKRPEHQWIAPAVLFVVLCSVWPARNLKVLHAFVPLRSNLGYELWQGNHPGGDGFFQEALHPNVNVTEYKRYKDLGEIAYMREKSQLAASWIRSNPRRFAVLTLKRAACFWTGLWRNSSIFLALSTSTLSLAGFLTLMTLFKHHRKLADIFAVPLLLLPLPYYITHPDFRFWCLLAPTLTMLAAACVVKVVGRLSGAEQLRYQRDLPLR